MRTVIVFESMFGNTEQFAQKIADGMSGAGVEVSVTDVRHATSADLQHCGLLVVGAPTHAFSLSRSSTRDDAVRQGAEPPRAALGVREWLSILDDAFPSTSVRPVVAVFDTRVDKVRRLPGSAAKKAARVMRSQGFRLVDRPASFYVVDVKGPAAPGEEERARAWARRLVSLSSGLSDSNAS